MKYKILFISILFVFALLFPGLSLAGTASYSTECGETITIGSYTHVYCSSCCVPCTTCTEDGCTTNPCCSTVPCCPCCNQHSCSGNWTEYRTDTNGCSPKIYKRECHSVCGPASDCCGCGSCQVQYGPEEEIVICYSWQKANRSCEVTSWGLDKPQCQCEGECVETPQNPRYYDNPKYFDQPGKSKDPNNIFLPVKLDWDNVAGWYKPDYVTPLDQKTIDDVPHPPTPDPPEPTPPPPPLEGEISLDVPIYYQNYPTGAGSWTNIVFSICKAKPETMSGFGCNQTSIAMILKSFGYDVTPLNIGNFVKDNGLWTTCVGISNVGLINRYRSQVPAPSYTHSGKIYDFNQITAELSKGRPILAGFKKYAPEYGHGGQHWITIRGVSADGKTLLINDPVYSWQKKHKGRISATKLKSYQLYYFISFTKLSEETASLYPDDQKTRLAETEAYSCQKNSFDRVYLSTYATYDGPSSYRFRITEDSTGNVTEKILDKSDFLPSQEIQSCFLKSDAGYTWETQACCSSSGTNCGAWSDNWKFHTNSSPELVAQMDPDWNGPEKETDAAIIGTLKWCEVKDTQAYKFLAYIIENGTDICHPLLEENGTCFPKILIPALDVYMALPIPEFANEEHGFFTKNFDYAWKVAACKDESATDCSDFSQKWKFSLADTVLESPKLISPTDDPSGNTPVGLPVSLQWIGELGAHSFIYEINSIVQPPISSPSIGIDSPELSIDTLYSWKVKSCWDYDGKNCEDNWSETRQFKTTGRAPKLDSPEGSNIQIPANFKWENVPGAKSFLFKIQGPGLDSTKVSDKPEIFFDYPELKQETDYSWQVKTCAKENGNLCGEWSPSKTFKTFKLSAPSNLSPSPAENISTYQMPRSFSWDPVPGAKFYKYTLNYISKSAEETGDCPTGQIIEENISGSSTFIALNCLGEYQWQVQACLDEDCNEAGEFSPIQTITLIQEAPAQKGGLVPCGRNYDDPDTIWNERETCQIKHLFLMVKIILEFLVWKIAPLLLLLMALATAIIFYTSFGGSAALAKVKSLWKAVGIGYGLIFLAWTIVNLALIFLGYEAAIFGPWYNIP